MVEGSVIYGGQMTIQLPIPGKQSTEPIAYYLRMADFSRSYINFAHGDEDLEVVYGSSLQRLQTLKKKYDPKNLFNHWFPLSPRPRRPTPQLEVE